MPCREDLRGLYPTLAFPSSCWRAKMNLLWPLSPPNERQERKKVMKLIGCNVRRRRSGDRRLFFFWGGVIISAETSESEVTPYVTAASWCLHDLQKTQVGVQQIYLHRLNYSWRCSEAETSAAWKHSRNVTKSVTRPLWLASNLPAPSESIQHPPHPPEKNNKKHPAPVCLLARNLCIHM